jgi:hypothetical protein
VAQIDPDLLGDIIDAAADLNPGDSMSPKVLRTLAQHLGARDLRRSAETGAGGSTVLFSHLSARHTAFAIEGNNSIITRLKSSLLLRKETTEFVEGPTQRTLPKQAFDRPLEAVLIDGPHAFPFPQLEYYYLYPNMASDGLLILDDIHIRTIHELYRFLCADEMFELVQVVERTAFFRRTTAPALDPFDDGWWLQAYNRKRLLRYVWPEVLTSSLPKPIRARLREFRAAIHSGLSPSVPYLIKFHTPRQHSLVDETALVRGSADLPPGACLCLLRVGQIRPAGGHKVGPSRYRATNGSKRVSSAKRPTRVMHSRLQPWPQTSEDNGGSCVGLTRAAVRDTGVP